MHYYQFNIGDYQSHTAHLTDIEDLAYRRLLDWYYLHELSIPLDLTEVARQIRMRTHSDCIASVLREYFERTEDGWIHHRANKEMAKVGEKSEKAAASAKARWDKPKDANALRTQSEGNATHNTLPITQDTLNTGTNVPSPPKGERKKLPGCAHQKVIDLYHQHLPTLRRVEVWNDARQAMLRSRWREVAAEMAEEKEVTEQEVLVWWEDFFQHIAHSKFLTGKVSGKDGRAFAADLEWIVRPTNFVKIVEGKYHGTN